MGIINRAIARYRRTTIPKWVIFLMDVCLAIAAFVITSLFRHSDADMSHPVNLLVKFLLMLVSTVVFFQMFGSYRSIIRHSGLNDIVKIILTCVSPALVWFLINFFNNNFYFFDCRFIMSYTEVSMCYTFLAMLMIGSRLMVQRLYNDHVRKHRPSRRVIIYGAGAAAVIAYDALLHDSQYEYVVTAFVDDNPAKCNQVLNGIRVKDPDSVLTNEFVVLKRVDYLIIAIPALSVSRKQEIINKGMELGLRVRTVPHINTWFKGSFDANQIRDIKIEDLLEREAISLDNENIVREVFDKVVLITGAAGSIGSEICRQLVQYHPAKIVMLDQAESPMYDLQFELLNTAPYNKWTHKMEFVIANVKDAARMEEVFAAFKPQVVYHAAAYKHVPFMEDNPYEAVFVNVFGTKTLADLAIKYRTGKFVMVSTDKAVNPTNVMGASKRMAEIYIQSRTSESTRFVTTRFGNVLGSNGSVVPLFKKQLASGGPLTVTHKDIIRYFMTIPEACNLVLEAGAMGNGGDIFVFDMGEPVKIYDLAKKMIQLSGLQNIEIKEVGLRPGEKLYEELLATKENTIPTHHPKIMRAQVRSYLQENVDLDYVELLNVLKSFDHMKLVAKMKSIVPEFISNNSVYCELDK